MKGFLVLPIFCAAVVYGKQMPRAVGDFKEDGLPVVHGYKHGDKCPGQHFYNDCNRCLCMKNGHSAACTKMACKPNQIPYEMEKAVLSLGKVSNNVAEERDGLPVVYGYQDGDKCPAQLFYNDCNRCNCGKDGHSAGCTKMACPPSPISSKMTRAYRSIENVTEERDGLPVVYGYKDGDKCPAQHFYNDCNKCICDANGHSAACNRMACPPKSILSKTVTSSRSVADLPHNDLFGITGECKPGVSFKLECNTCHCLDDGKSAACTLMACPKYYETTKPRIDGYQSGDACVANDIFYIKCNICRCAPNGRSASFCTAVPCEYYHI